MHNLAKMVAEQMGYDDIKNKEFIETMHNVASNGASAGFGGFTSYNDTTEFYNKHKDKIWEHLNEDAEEQGETVLKMIASFGGAKDVSDATGFENLLAWYALEKVAQHVVSLEEEE